MESSLSKERRINSFGFETLFILLFSIFTLRSVWLAFDIPIVFVPLGYFCVLLGLLNFYKYEFEKEDFKYLLLPCTYWVMGYLHPSSEYKVMFDLLNLLITCCFLLLSKSIKASIFRCFYWIIQILNLISILIYVCYFTGIPLSFEKVAYYRSDAEKLGMYYIKWHMFAIYNEFVIFYRLCGIFNEPGALGTLCGLLFTVTYTKSKTWEKILLLITGILTVSMAFFLIIVLCVFLNLLKKSRKWIFLPILLLPLLILLPKIDFGNESINRFVQRFEITDEGIAGNNRVTDEYKIKFDEFNKSAKSYFGLGQGYSLATGSSSYKQYIVWFGYIGAGVIFSLWIIFGLLYTHSNIDSIIFLLIFFISIYQRPAAIIQIYGYVLLFGGMSWLNPQSYSESFEKS